MAKQKLKSKLCKAKCGDGSGCLNHKRYGDLCWLHHKRLKKIKI